jgi:hypothetical protein
MVAEPLSWAVSASYVFTLDQGGGAFGVVEVELTEELLELEFEQFEKGSEANPSKSTGTQNCSRRACGEDWRILSISP